MTSELKPGDRCLVMDLRTGTLHEGEIVEVLELDGIGGKCVVRYDSGKVVRVGASFVTKRGPGRGKDTR